jgi:hypothetical protein
MVRARRAAYRDGVLGSLFAPWRRRSTWWDLGYSVLSLPIGALTFTFAVSMAATSLGLIVTFLLAIPFLWLLFVAVGAWAASSDPGGRRGGSGAGGEADAGGLVLQA